MDQGDTKQELEPSFHNQTGSVGGREEGGHVFRWSIAGLGEGKGAFSGGEAKEEEEEEDGMGIVCIGWPEEGRKEVVGINGGEGLRRDRGLDTGGALLSVLGSAGGHRESSNSVALKQLGGAPALTARELHLELLARYKASEVTREQHI